MTPRIPTVKTLSRFQCHCRQCGQRWAETGHYASIAKEHACWIAYQATTTTRSYPGGVYDPNGWKFTMKLIKGTYCPEITCDSRCTHAKGSTCDCSCGGANHGSQQ